MCPALNTNTNMLCECEGYLWFTCVVFGLGGVSSAIVMGCKASGTSRIIGVDINKEKFPQALAITDCLNLQNSQKLVQEVVMEMMGIDVDFAFI